MHLRLRGFTSFDMSFALKNHKNKRMPRALADVRVAPDIHSGLIALVRSVFTIFDPFDRLSANPEKSLR